jgi:hypothetical protein
MEKQLTQELKYKDSTWTWYCLWMQKINECCVHLATGYFTFMAFHKKWKKDVHSTYISNTHFSQMKVWNKNSYVGALWNLLHEITFILY